MSVETTSDRIERLEQRVADLERRLAARSGDHWFGSAADAYAVDIGAHSHTIRTPDGGYHCGGLSVVPHSLGKHR
jgi:hypothetical protein